MTSSSECTRVRAIGQLDPVVIAERAEPILAAATHLSPSCWEAERVLSQSKWFDYRYLSPVQATLLFVEEYQQVFRLKWKASFNAADAEKKRGVAAGGLFHSRKEFSEFWSARAHADYLGVDYQLYISTAMETALRRAKQKRLLRAGQMRRADCVRAVEARWDEELAGGRWLSEAPHYRAENDCALPDQIAHHEHVVRTIGKRSNPVIALGTAVDALRVLPVERAEAAFGVEPVASARERADGLGPPAPVEPLASGQLIPSCFGLPAPLDVTADPCCRCPLAGQCWAASERILAEVAALHGSHDPARHHRRKLGAERARRFRERKRLASAGVASPGGVGRTGASGAVGETVIL